MTAKDKVADLVVKMMETVPDSIIQSNEDALAVCKLHATISVDLVIEELKSVFKGIKKSIGVIFWEDVRKEIDKL